MNLNGRRPAALLFLIPLVAACSPATSQAIPVTPLLTITTIVQAQPTVTVTETVTVIERTEFTLPTDKIFDRVKVEQGVMTVLTGATPAGYGYTGITEVSCPENQPVKAGTSFTCDVIVNGFALESTIVVKDSQGLYEVNPPR